MKVVITGGAGFVGRATVRAAVEAGHHVRIVSRDPWPSGSMFERLGVEVVTGDAQEPAVMNRALDGMDALVQAAATYRYDRRAGPAMANNAALARPSWRPLPGRRRRRSSTSARSSCSPSVTRRSPRTRP